MDVLFVLEFVAQPPCMHGHVRLIVPGKLKVVNSLATPRLFLLTFQIEPSGSICLIAIGAARLPRDYSLANVLQRRDNRTFKLASFTNVTVAHDLELMLPQLKYDAIDVDNGKLCLGVDVN